MNGLGEAMLILAHTAPYHSSTDGIISTLGLSPNSVASIRINPSFLLGTLMTSLGAYIRHVCYRTLGRFYTFELSIRGEHQLVTGGPYSVVRHPAYTGGILATIGIHFCIFGPGSLLRASGILDSEVGKIITGGAVLHFIFNTALRVHRTIEEDRVLRQQFGERWKQWAARVQYRLVPYVF
ncbi:hypothetical protein NEOLEDRAFT_1120276 [Neolentinus lepideus HHB14362 ss-1]|uniref:Protein-S-isoprenylcysteine O-methyltransferase n=1 Tax=Neolentinus lepideus HHB14362 ss-1 TaxID=1314782 RepID=A0A165Q6Z2_9AGAM|nr:hypothetical protein NEOLEDRAFT_1120276 [Neolentinus lepideus HHB14362 ss-1]